MSDQLVEDVYNDLEHAVSRSAIRSVLWVAQGRGWRVVKTEPLPASVRGDGLIYAEPSDEVVEIIDEWLT